MLIWDSAKSLFGQTKNGMNNNLRVTLHAQGVKGIFRQRNEATLQTSCAH